ncbi:MAG: sensor histidine kinase [Rhizomicrobium sp.]
MSSVAETGVSASKRAGLLARIAGLSAKDDDGHFRGILDALPAALYITDPEGRITYYNEAAAELWGHRPTLGTSAWCGSWKLYWNDGRPMPHDECPMAVAVRERRPIRGESAVAERPDGSRVSFIPYPTPLYDAAGLFVGAVNMLVDVADRNRADDYAQRLSAIVESSDDAIVSKDLNGIIMSWNAGAERLFGYGREEVIGKSITILIPEERVDEEPGILKRIRKGERINHYETVRRRKDGTLIDVSLTVSPINDSHGRVIGASKIARDITERKRSQQQQSLLLNEMKHRIKNTLATVQALATQTLRGVSADELARFNARLIALGGVHDMMTLESWNEIAIGDVIQGALNPFRELHRERIVVSGSGNVYLDGTKSLQLAMVLHELATNAVKYGALSNGSGSVRLAWEVDSPAHAARLRWHESGGPPVSPPDRKGFGSKLIEYSTQNAQLDYRPEGFACRWDMAL